MVNESTPTFACQCPPCFRQTSSGTCEPACDLSVCDNTWGSDGCAALRPGGRVTVKKGECAAHLMLEGTSMHASMPYIDHLGNDAVHI